MFSFFKWTKSEALFVSGVLVVLLVISTAQLRIGQMKARDAQRKADAELVGRALDKYFADHDFYPVADAGRIVACGGYANAPCPWPSGPVRDAEGVVYIKMLPQDPLTHLGRTYVYVPSADLLHYRVYVALEYARDVDWKSDLTTACGNELQCNWYVGNF